MRYMDPQRCVEALGDQPSTAVADGVRFGAGDTRGRRILAAQSRRSSLKVVRGVYRPDLVGVHPAGDDDRLAPEDDPDRVPVGVRRP